MTPDDARPDGTSEHGTERGVDRDGASWISVSEAAARAGVDTGVVRHWYRAGRIPTRRGERGAFLVPVDGVLALAADLMEQEDASQLAPSADETAAAEVERWRAQAEAAREAATAARQELLERTEALREVEEQLAFLRSQLAEASEENRNLRERFEAATARADEAVRLREEAASVGSITDFSWVERTRPYESPVRPQERLGTPLTGLLANVQKDEPDTAADPWAHADVEDRPALRANAGTEEGDGASARDGGLLDDESVEPANPLLGIPAHHGYGDNEDDVLPVADRKGRRRG